MERQITPNQLKMIHILLKERGLMDQKENIVTSFSDGRTNSSRDLTMKEAKALIDYLIEDDKKKAIIKGIWHLAYITNMIYGDTYEDGKMNAAKLNLFCIVRGTVKKNIELQTLSELKKTHRQFEGIYRKQIETQDKEKYIITLRKKLEGHLLSEDYEGCKILQDEINSLTKNRRKKKDERILAK